uniref:Uncharacterized protein n=1 Tax=viral metagenome TaxID=1070528 RepID=A0A6C0BR06_9ZZZZ
MLIVKKNKKIELQYTLCVATRFFEEEQEQDATAYMAVWKRRAHAFIP